jgi:hypothetical protein
VTVRLRARESGDMAGVAIPPATRLMKIRHVAGHGAAIAVTPYLLIKILWTFGLFLLLAGTMPDALPNPDYPLAQALTTAVGMVLGVMMGIIILLVLHDRQRAMRRISRDIDRLGDRKHPRRTRGIPPGTRGPGLRDAPGFGV